MFNGKLQLALTPKIHKQNVAGSVDNGENRRGLRSSSGARIVTTAQWPRLLELLLLLEVSHKVVGVRIWPSEMFFSLFEVILTLCVYVPRY